MRMIHKDLDQASIFASSSSSVQSFYGRVAHIMVGSRMIIGVVELRMLFPFFFNARGNS